MNLIGLVRLGCLLFWMVQASAGQEVDFKNQGAKILKEIVSKEWALDWKDAKLGKVRLVSQKADLARPTGLPPVWVGVINGPGESKGMLMWESVRKGHLVEFTLDANLKIPGAISGVPNQQQFPVRDSDGKEIASGCVPTAAANVLSFWSDKKFPQWRDGKSVVDLTKRLRARLRMMPFPDTDGFTSDGMTLAGAFPHELAKAIRVDAEERGVGIECRIAPFSFELLQEEIKAGRPVLLSCTVRVPHKPHLSWGHEVVGVAWTTIGGVEMVGVVDNFYPTKHSETIRWIREDVFRSLIGIRPKTK